MVNTETISRDTDKGTSGQWTRYNLFQKNSNYKLMPNVEAICDLIKYEKPEKLLFKEILNVWKDKYNTSE